MKTPRLELEQIERDWRAARPDVNPDPMLTVIAVQRASHALQTALEAFFARHDLTPSAFDVLATLRRSSPPEGLTLGELAQRMAITPPAVTKRVDGLERRGWVVRQADAGDRRTVRAALTPRGREAVDHLLADHVAHEEALLRDLTPGERATLRALLGRLPAQPEQE
ncbi:MarR family transcriptional regulator [Deinococcus metallilatus]|uniref:MarR family transcriptional regulator n=1 Tax=Deinococcus metallilatus TaxID=1211322 RepID=A0AAJ5K4F4_9DEIO|nr:MarR family transcriptional regulator [Deinococcus metallilatus]MBB5296383.1 DNA-binding MarR family transcriptional regulator [Deinococcus metallilatus]QBY09942.1 MarR family transcriptional regulator [Deinococcus metallilatus]RXJ08666.1 MarR family transcriptional regulator [Deinococcus metallilatus]TLK25140.1 MarR family transcriptional regulator [Deinococcus metallilatus]GMA14704.1 MarR family transcriptional regulator [Deinococcus metallilatus]